MEKLKSPNPKSTTQLARLLNLSRWTVSRVINGHDDVHPDTARRVRAAMQELGFAPNPLAQGLRRGRTDIVGVCVPEFEDFYLGPKLDYLRTALAEESLRVMIGMAHTPAEEGRTLNHFHLSRAAAVVLFATHLAPDDPSIVQFRNAGIPFVCVDPIAPWQGSASAAPTMLQVNRARGMQQATEHLLGLGHRSIALLGISGESSYTKTRHQAAEETINRAKSHSGVGATLHSLALPTAANLYAAGRESAARYFSPAARSAGAPTAVLALNDRVAIGFIDGLRALGLSVPGDISVIGYDNMDVSSYVTPTLSTIATRPDALIYEATQAVLRELDAAAVAGSQRQTPAPRLIPSRLIIRQSSGPAR